MTDFRLCSTRRSRSQAPLCHYTRRLIANQAEGTFGRLRYSLGGDRPSQTAHLAGSPEFIGVRAEIIKERYFKVDSTTTGVAASQSPTLPLNHRPSEIEVRVKMLVSCRRTERPRGPLLQFGIGFWSELCRIGGRLGSMGASSCGVNLEIPPFSCWKSNFGPLSGSKTVPDG